MGAGDEVATAVGAGAGDEAAKVEEAGAVADDAATGSSAIARSSALHECRTGQAGKTGSRLAVALRAVADDRDGQA